MKRNNHDQDRGGGGPAKKLWRRKFQYQHNPVRPELVEGLLFLRPGLSFDRLGTNGGWA